MTEYTAPFLAFSMVFIAILICTWLYNDFSCLQIQKAIQTETEYKVFVGCMIKLKDGSFIPYDKLRYID